MRILAIDTSAAVASCCLLEDGMEKGFKSIMTNMDHSRAILPLCEELLGEHGLRFADIDAFAAAVGPGSFTGIRIGVSAVKGFALSGDKKAAGVSSLEAAARETACEGLICSVIRARDDEYYYGFFKRQRGGVFRICPDGCLRGKELGSLLYGSKWTLCGDGEEDFLSRHGNVPAVLSGVRQSARGVALAAWELYLEDALEDSEEIVPVYIKKTQAERMREEKEHENSNRI